MNASRYRAFKIAHPLHAAWMNIRRKCGIIGGLGSRGAYMLEMGFELDERWTRYPEFEHDMMNLGWTNGLWICRRDTNIGWTRENVYIGNQIKSANSRRCARRGEFGGETCVIREALEKHGERFSRHRLQYVCKRLREGLSMEDAVRECVKNRAEIARGVWKLHRAELTAKVKESARTKVRGGNGRFVCARKDCAA